MTKTMRVFRLRQTDTGGKKLVLGIEDIPSPKAGEILVRIHAVSLNYRDLMIADGRANAIDGLVPLSDGAGTVHALGAGVRKWKVKDRVVGLFFQNWLKGPYELHYGKSALGGNSQSGVLSEYVIFPEDGVIGFHDQLTFEHAASLPCAALTAWQAMFVRTSITERDVVLILGTGGVSTFSLQFAHAVGARTILLSSSDRKLSKAAEFGATDVINYKKNKEWDRKVLDLTSGRGATFILENGGPKTFDQSLRSLAPGGRIAQIGVLTGFGPSSNLMRLQNINADILGITVGSAEHLISMLSFIKENSIIPLIDKTFHFNDAQLAYEYLRDASHVGKVIISIGSN